MCADGEEWKYFYIQHFIYSFMRQWWFMCIIWIIKLLLVINVCAKSCLKIWVRLTILFNRGGDVIEKRGWNNRSIPSLCLSERMRMQRSKYTRRKRRIRLQIMRHTNMVLAYSQQTLFQGQITHTHAYIGWKQRSFIPSLWVSERMHTKQTKEWSKSFNFISFFLFYFFTIA